MQSPLVTIVTVVFNDVTKIEGTIENVLSQYLYYENIEYIIIDGGSTDGTVDVINRYSDRINYWVSEPDRGVYDAMNKAIKLATGNWICFMNSGDLFANSDVIAKIVSAINEESQILYGDTFVTTEYGCNLVKAKECSYLKNNMPFCHQSTLVRTDIIKPFDTSYRFVADYNFFYKSYMEGLKFQYVSLAISVFDATEGLTASNKRNVFKEILRVRKDTDNIISRGLFMCKYYRYFILEQIKRFFPSFVKAIRN